MTTPVADVNGDGTLAHASALQEAYDMLHLAPALQEAYDMLHLAPPDEPPRRRTLQESYDLQVAEAVDSTAAESPCKKQKRKKIAVGDDDEEEEVKDTVCVSVCASVSVCVEEYGTAVCVCVCLRACG
jgi:hypothetical protein